MVIGQQLAKIRPSSVKLENAGPLTWDKVHIFYCLGIQRQQSIVEIQLRQSSPLIY